MNILVTRPNPAATELVVLLRKYGIKAWSFPLIYFVPGRELNLLPNKILSIKPRDMIFVLSKRAIIYADHYLKKTKTTWPSNVEYYSIGRASAQILQQITGKCVKYPRNQETSDALINIPSLQEIKNKRTLILSGNGGRQLLANTLRDRGSNVSFCECYQRYNNVYSSIIECNRWKNYGINTIVVTSCEMLKQLFSLFYIVDVNKWLLQCRILVVSNRLANLAYQLGWENIEICDNATNQALLNKLIHLYNK
ncbi:uroporphyrinogen-III synthase [Candidatus Ishikawella capsulata]|uniref:Uroporphyrinogen-III synthase n=1 Tax=Candidatus Ishikawaella capsulata Mpkobe TaxID=476281 RepID=C5WDQ8_9ENTR|nr:uroporphyrinogen-III synthase [Candidatus Ishikawaella capsulata]BAH83464.1 uroporphyrinogen-III synthetase [Candidatus Ishikawaella capsulata Mpkobe]